MTATVTGETFDPAMISGFPEPAHRWLRHAIAPGTPLWDSVELTMHGRIKLGRWRPFTARQVLSPPGGYTWAATARLAGLPVTGYDRLISGAGEMRWRLLRLFPVLTAAGPDITRSAYGRMAGEIVLSPTAFRTAARSAGDALPQASFAACAASSASSMSCGPECATSQNGCPVDGVMFSRYSPVVGAIQWPPMKLS